MARVFLLTGGNLGDVKRTLQRAQQLINDRIGPVLHCSHRYESAPWGFETAGTAGTSVGKVPPFFNQALELSTDLTPDALLDAVQEIERELGRNRAAEAVEKAATGASYASRPIDIDILFYGDEQIATERLTLPHPQLAERRFVLVPLCEIARSKRHPVTGLTIQEMLDQLNDQ